MTLFERAGYYGVRAIIVLYAVDEGGLNMDQSNSLLFYSILTGVLLILPIPFGYLTDKFLGQTRSIYVGGILACIGYALLTMNNPVVFYISFVLIVAGISLVKPSTIILVGRQYKKEDRNRTLAYFIFFFGINLGAFLGSLAKGYAGEYYGWKWGFISAASFTIVYLILFKLFGSDIIQRESNTLKDSGIILKYKKMLPLLIICILVYMVYTKCSETASFSYTIEVIESGDKTILGFELFNYMINSISTFWSIPISLAIFIYWKIKGVGSTFVIIRLSFIILIGFVLLRMLSFCINSEYSLDYAILPLAMFALADAIISPLITSYITRIADVNYSNTIYAMFIFLTYFLGAGFMYLIFHDYETVSILIILVLTISLLFIFREFIDKLTHEID